MTLPFNTSVHKSENKEKKKPAEGSLSDRGGRRVAWTDGRGGRGGQGGTSMLLVNTRCDALQLMREARGQLLTTHR